MILVLWEIWWPRRFSNKHQELSKYVQICPNMSKYLPVLKPHELVPRGGSGFDVKVMPEDLERVQALARPGT